ncbi:hypothetical protein NQ315_003998, partial [Exocentrus adspersus]
AASIIGRYLNTQYRGPSNKKRRIISTAAQSIMLYGAEIWAPAMDVQKYRKQLETVHRRLLIRVVAAIEPFSRSVAGYIRDSPY